MSDLEQRIEELVAEFLDSILRGEDPDRLRDELIAKHSELQPGLEKRLRFVETVFNTVGSNQGGLGSTVTEPGVAPNVVFPTEQARCIDCPNCGVRVNVVAFNDAEVTCANCGSVVTVGVDQTITAAFSEIPAHIGRFQIHSVLGSGGFGTAYRATDPRLNRTVAVKVPRAGHFLSRVEKERFIREARSGAQLRHPHIVQVYEVNSDDSIPYIVSEFIDGVSLGDRISGQRLSLTEAVRIVAVVAEAVHYAHEHGIIHRDLKPSNIFLNLQNTPFIADFGLARNLDAEFTMTVDGEILGTPAYMSPEQASGQHSRVNAKSDVYSLGVTLYQLLCCTHPFRGSARMLLHQVIHEDPQAPRKIDETIPVDLETITLKAMDKHPDKRYATAKALSEDLIRWSSDQAILARPESRVSKLRRWRRRNARLAGLLGVVFGLLLVISILSTVWAVREAKLTQIADANAQEAKGNQRQSDRRLTASLVQNGLRELETGVHSSAVLWFAKALESTVDDPEIHRTRIGMTLDRHPKLGMLKSVNSTVRYRKLIFDRGGSHFIVPTNSGVLFRFTTDSHESAPLQMVHDAMLADAVPNATGDRVITCCKKRQSAYLWDFRSGSRIAMLQHSANVSAVGFSSDGGLAASCDEAGQVRVWDPRNGTLVAEFEHEPGRLRLQFLPNSTRLLTYIKCLNEQEVTKATIWNVEDGTATPEVEVTSNVSIARADEIPDTLILSSVDGAVSLWSAADGKMLVEPLQHAKKLLELYALPNRDELLTLQLDGTITLWSTKADRIDVVRHPVAITDAAIDPQRRFVAVAGVDGNVAIYWCHSLQKIGPSLATDESVTSVDFHPDGRRLIAGGNSGVVRMWDLAGMAPNVPLLQHSDEVNVARFSPSGDHVVTCSDDDTAVIWNSHDGGRIGNALNHSDDVTDCHFNQDGRYVATGSLDNTAQIWNAFQATASSNPFSHASSVVKLRFSPIDNELLVTASADGTISGWRPGSSESVFASQRTMVNITDLRFSANGSQLLAASVDGIAVVRSARDGKALSSPLTHGDAITRCGFSSHEGLIWTCSRDKTISFWNDQAPLRPTRRLTFRDWPTAVATEQDGVRFLTSNYSGSLALWRSDTRLWEFHRRKYYFKHCEIDRQSRFALVCGGSALGIDGQQGAGAAFLVDLRAGLLVAPAFEHFANVERAFFDPTGRRVLTSSHDHTARIWKIVTDNRSISDISQQAMILTGKTISESFHLVRIEPRRLVNMFNESIETTPEAFVCDARQVQRWEDYVRWVRLRFAR